MAEENKTVTPEAMKQWEDRLGPEKVARAIDLVRSHGWRAGDTPPIWVWAEAFRQVESGNEVYGVSRSSLQDGVLGFRLF